MRYVNPFFFFYIYQKGARDVMDARAIQTSTFMWCSLLQHRQ